VADVEGAGHYDGGGEARFTSLSLMIFRTDSSLKPPVTLKTTTPLEFTNADPGGAST